MPTDATDFYGTVFQQGSATLLARIVDGDARPLKPADVATAAYSVFLLDPHRPERRVPVAGHTAVPLEPAAVLCDTLQTAGAWTRDATGYNFRHTLDVRAQPAFATAGRHYLVEYRLMPNAGPPILVRFRAYVL